MDGVRFLQFVLESHWQKERDAFMHINTYNYPTVESGKHEK
jgi:hypothetical protein